MTAWEGTLIARLANAIAEGVRPPGLTDGKNHRRCRIPKDTTQWPYRIEVRWTTTAKDGHTRDGRRTEYKENREGADDLFYQYQRMVNQPEEDGDKLTKLSMTMFYGPGNKVMVESYEYPSPAPSLYGDG